MTYMLEMFIYKVLKLLVKLFLLGLLVNLVNVLLDTNVCKACTVLDIIKFSIGSKCNKTYYSHFRKMDNMFLKMVFLLFYKYSFFYFVIIKITYSFVKVLSSR